jgi:Lipocalin-like domain
MYVSAGEQSLARELLKNGDVPKSPLAPPSSPSAIGGHNFNSKIDLGFYRGCRRHPHIGTCAALLRAHLRVQTTARRKNTMNRLATLAVTTTALLCLAVGLSASDSIAPQQSLKEQLVGAWTLVSSDQVRPDGSKLKQFGANPKGINVFDANGRFFLMVASADNSQIASKDPSKTTSEEDGLIVESIAYYGTYTVNEEVNVINLHLDASTFPNQIGTDQKRAVTSLTADELKYSSPAAISGVQVHQVWKRAE